MVSLYEEIKSKESVIRELTDLGIVPVTIIRDMEIVDKFNTRPDACKECRYEWIAKLWKMSPDNVKKIVIRMKRK